MHAQNALFALLYSLTLPARAAWVATTPQAQQAVKIAHIASALEATARFDQAILRKDVAVFESMFDEEAARLGEHDVVLMGEESLTPQGRAKMAGKQLRRRTTEVWSDASDSWKLLLRQATIYLAQ